MQKKFFIPIVLQEQLKRFITGSDTGSTIDPVYYKYAYVLHRLYFSKSTYRYAYERGIAFNVEELARIFGINNGEATAILKNLINWSMIKCVGNYSSGRHARLYQIGTGYEDLKYNIMTVDLKDAGFIRKLVNEQNDFNKSSIVKKQYSILKDKVTINQQGLGFLRSKYPSLKKAIDNYPGDIDVDYSMQIEAMDIILVSLLIKDIFVARPVADSRIYTNLTSLKKEYRKFISIDGKPIVQTDIVNSQVLFSVILIEQKLRQLNKGKEYQLPEDFIRYKMLAQEGLLYEAVAEEVGIYLNENNRKDFKPNFYKDVFFSKVAKWTTPIKTAFYKLFPSVAFTIEKIKEKDYKDFATSLQKMEAKIMIDQVLKKLYKSKVPALSIHDSIVVNNEQDLMLAERLIRDELRERYGLEVKLKTEGMDTESTTINLDKEFFNIKKAVYE